MAGRTLGRTPISSGETPTRERSADHREAGTGQRELIQDILGPDPSTSSGCFTCSIFKLTQFTGYHGVSFGWNACKHQCYRLAEQPME